MNSYQFTLLYFSGGKKTKFNNIDQVKSNNLFKKKFSLTKKFLLFIIFSKYSLICLRKLACCMFDHIQYSI